MEKTDKRDQDILITHSREYMVDNLDVQYFMTYLRQEDIITIRILEEIKAEGTTRGRVKTLLDKLPTRGPQAMIVCLGANKLDYHHFVWQKITAERCPTGEKVGAGMKGLHEGSTGSQPSGPETTMIQGPSPNIKEVIITKEMDKSKNKESNWEQKELSGYAP